MPGLRQLVGLINFCTVYYTTQLVRCAAFSFALIGVVELFRKILFSKRAFFRGMLWALFLIIPFLGRLKLFYENEAVLRATWWIMAVTVSWLWADRIYMAGILVGAICIFGKRLRLQRTVAGMEKVMFENVRIYVTDMNITPFTVGLLKPKIVLPKVMADSYSKSELKIIIQHEKTHIRLGHLWYGFAWDILRCLLWINPFLTVFQRHFRADMEDICDRVCIQNSEKTAHEYGSVLLKFETVSFRTGGRIACRHLCGGKGVCGYEKEAGGNRRFPPIPKMAVQEHGSRGFSGNCRCIAGCTYAFLCSLQ